MSNDNKVRYCPNCLGADIDYKKYLLPNGCVRDCSYSTLYKGFVADELRPDECLICGKPLTIMDITIDEWKFLTAHSKDINFIIEMDKIKHNSIVDFTIKVEQLINNAKLEYAIKSQSQQSNVPKCPTCGSTNIKKISGTRRWLGVGLFGIASSDVGKTRECNDCGYKW